MRADGVIAELDIVHPRRHCGRLELRGEHHRPGLVGPAGEDRRDRVRPHVAGEVRHTAGRGDQHRHRQVPDVERRIVLFHQLITVRAVPRTAVVVTAVGGAGVEDIALHRRPRVVQPTHRVHRAVQVRMFGRQVYRPVRTGAQPGDPGGAAPSVGHIEAVLEEGRQFFGEEGLVLHLVLPFPVQRPGETVHRGEDEGVVLLGEVVQGARPGHPRVHRGGVRPVDELRDLRVALAQRRTHDHRHVPAHRLGMHLAAVGVGGAEVRTLGRQDVRRRFRRAVLCCDGRRCQHRQRRSCDGRCCRRRHPGHQDAGRCAAPPPHDDAPGALDTLEPLVLPEPEPPVPDAPSPSILPKKRSAAPPSSAARIQVSQSCAPMMSYS